MEPIAEADLPTFIVDSRVEAEALLAGEITALVRAHPDCVLGLATGSSPIGVYRALCTAHRRGDVSFSGVKTFNLDEYLGLADGHSQSFRRWMQEQLFDTVRPQRTHLPTHEGPLESAHSTAARYEEAVRSAGGIDLQVLGIGLNGHIGFNEPGSALDSRTRVVELHPVTREKAVREFGDIARVPTHAVTMGVATILDARRIRVLAFGRDKSQIVRRTLFDPVSPECPSTFLRGHRDVKLYVDRQAGALLGAGPSR